MTIPISLTANYPVIRELADDLRNLDKVARAGLDRLTWEEERSLRLLKCERLLQAFLAHRDDGSSPGHVLDAIEIAARELLEG